jgi:hypothetical protein
MNTTPSIVTLVSSRVGDTSNVMRQRPRSVRERIRLVVRRYGHCLSCKRGHNQGADLGDQSIHLEDLSRG